jgi:hypothetical protein
MKTINFKAIYPHLIAVAVFLSVAVIYCKPALEGKVLQQSDVTQWKGMAQDALEYREKNGITPLWTNSMFSGMPAYQIAMDQDYPVSIQYLSYIFTLGLPKPVNFFFLACLSAKHLATSFLTVSGNCRDCCIFSVGGCALPRMIANPASAPEGVPKVRTLHL